MNLLDWKCFVAVVEELNFTRAASRLYLTQQSVSGHIAKLESHYGISLFERKTPLVLTEAGARLYPYAMMIIDAEEQARSMIQDTRDCEHSTIRIGVPTYNEDQILSKILPRFHRENPGVRIQIVENSLGWLKDALYQGELDVCFHLTIVNSEPVQCDVLQDDNCVIVVPKNIFETHFSPLAQESMLKQERLSLSVFQDCPFIPMAETTKLGKILNEYCQERNLQLNRIFELTNSWAVVSMAAAGMGVAVCPECYLAADRIPQQLRSQLVVFHWDCPQANSKLTISYLKNRYQPQCVQSFVKLAKELLGHG